MTVQKNHYLIFSSLAVLLLAAAAISLIFGGTDIPLGQVVRALFRPGDPGITSTILWDIRFPRIALAVLVGMGLAASGCVFQGMLRNPLADPYTLGVSGGAALGAAIGILAGLASLSVIFLPLCAFTGTLVCAFLVYSAASRKYFSLSTLILSGVILGFICSSLVLLIFAFSTSEKVHTTVLWLMGDLSSPDTALLKVLPFIIVPGIAFLALFGQELNLLTLGEEKASHLGVDAESVKKILFAAASLVTAACVSASGIIGFVGLIIPHFMRRLTGPDHRVLIPASALTGGAFLTLCDTAARAALSPVELPVGVVTGLCGGLFFLVFLFRSERSVF